MLDATDKLLRQMKQKPSRPMGDPFPGFTVPNHSGLKGNKDSKNYVESNPTTLTAGSIPFSNGSALTQDNTNLFWDATNKRLGIGTATPTNSLEIGSTTTGKNADIEATLGAEMCPALEAANWTLGAGWSAGSGIISKVAAGASSVATPSGTFTVTVGRTYLVVVVVDASNPSGYLFAEIGGAQAFLLTAGTRTQYVTALTTAKFRLIDYSSSETCTISSISVKELTPNTGDLDIKGRLYARSPISFKNPVLFNGSLPSDIGAAPIHVIETGSEGIRVQRSNTPGQYITINQVNGAAHEIRGVGSKVFQFANNITGTGHNFLFYVNSSTIAMSIDGNGNVGIGIGTPSEALSVSGSAIIGGSLTVGTAATNTFTTVDGKTVTVSGGIVIGIV